MTKTRNIIRHEKKLLALLNTLFLTEKILPELKHVVVTRVDLTMDFYVVKVYVDSASKKNEKILNLLKEQEHLFKREIITNLNFKKIPQFEWYLDKSIEAMTRMDQIFKKIKDNK